MFSNDKNIETLADLIEKLKEYIGLQKDLLQLNAIEKTVRILTLLVLTIVLSFFALLVVIFLSFAAAEALALIMPSPLAYLIIAAIYFVLFILVYNKRHTWIERPLVSMFADILTN